MDAGRLMLLAHLLADWRAGGPFPGYPRLQRELMCTRREAADAIASIEQAGYARREHARPPDVPDVIRVRRITGARGRQP